MPKDLNGAQTGMTPSNNINNPRPNNQRGRNIFPQTHMHLTTDRYGEYSPFFWCKAERGDIQNLMSNHDLHTYTMQSPFVGQVSMTKSFVKVPMQAIYPHNWEKMMTIPTQGDDVPSDTRALLDVPNLVRRLLAVINTSSSIPEFLKSLLLLESICSHGSLFSRFNQHFNYKFSIDDSIASELGIGNVVSIDKLMDTLLIPILLTGRISPLIISGHSVYIRSSDDQFDTPEESFVSIRRFIEILRSGDFEFSEGWFQTPIDFNLSLSLESGYLGGFNDLKLINIEPIISYQLACAQFGTNDFVDFIYSAPLYRDNMLAIAEPLTGVEFFTYNGSRYMYDIFSQHYFDILINAIGTEESDVALDFFLNLFSYQNSLRYGDYFTGAKPRPLAVGEYSAQVVNNEVSAIDVTRSVQMQRLLNRVNMVGRKLGDYLAGIFGGKLPEAPKDIPVFLAHQKFDISGFETNNTGSEQLNPEVQNTITSHLRASESRHSFEIEIDEPCYIIGMNSYEMMRIYSKTLDRFAFHYDRYDDFIPEMQYIGDQEIFLGELDSTLLVDKPFGYCLRYMEYKQRYSYASGGFIENLPSWSFITDNKDGNPSDEFINPLYIRSSPSEFDRFYKSLTGYSLGSYFHFIVAHTNVTDPIRMMEYTPEILK